MDRLIRQQTCRIYTGGRNFDPRLPSVVLIHGAGHDHSVWHCQARHLAHHGFGVLAPDLPGHGASAGAPLESIDAMAEWLLDMLEACGVEHFVLAGHSMGSLIALATAARARDRTRKLILIGSVAPMPVAPALIDAACSAPGRAHAMINQWSYSAAAQLGASASPGTSLLGINQCLMARQAEGVLATDLRACDAWHEGLSCAAQVSCPTLLIGGQRDQMTPPRAVKPLFDALVNVAGGARMMTLQGAGHAMMAEAPQALNNAIRGFLNT